jgi:hypothetical protein
VAQTSRLPASFLAKTTQERTLKNILAIALLVASAAAFPVATPVFADSSTNALCGPGAPEGYKRPGGYCEQLDNKGSLVEQDDCDNYYLESLATLKPGEVILVAENCYEVKVMK